MVRPPVLALVCSACGGLEGIRIGLVEPLVADGVRVAITLTPTAWRWLDSLGETGRLEELTGYAVRSASRLPQEPKPHPPMDCCVVVPASANTLAKVALGIADNQALTQAYEAFGAIGVPVVVFPHSNIAHPAFAGHVAALRGAGARVLDLTGRRTGAGLPWEWIRMEIGTALEQRHRVP